MSNWKDLEETLVNASIKIHADAMELSQELELTKDSEGKDLLDQHSAVLAQLDACLALIKSCHSNKFNYRTSQIPNPNKHLYTVAPDRHMHCATCRKEVDRVMLIRKCRTCKFI